MASFFLFRHKEQNSRLSFKGQTATELAIFGAVLVFVLGLIVRYSVNFNYNQNMQLKSMRLAMAWSYVSGIHHSSPERAVSSIVLIEDRQEATLNLFGSQERTQYVAQSSAAFTNNLMLTGDFGVDKVPVIDLLVNGQHFPLSTGKYKKVQVARVHRGDSDDCRSARITPCQGGEGDCAVNNLSYLHPEFINYSLTAFPPGDMRGPRWMENCFSHWYSHGCGIFYTKVANVLGAPDPRFCTDEATCLTQCDCPDLATCQADPAKRWCMASVEDRFDLDRTGDSEVPDVRRVDFSWQWYRMKGTRKKMNFNDTQTILADVDFDGKEEEILGYEDQFGYYQLSYHPDTTNDLALLMSHLPDAYDDTIYEYCFSSPTVTTSGGLGSGTHLNTDCEDENADCLDDDYVQPCKEKKECRNGEATLVRFFVLDQQDGDWDTTYDTSDERRPYDSPYPRYKPAPGLIGNAKMYTKTKFSPGSQGTFFLVQQGKLYDPALPNATRYVRTTQRSDRIDMIERQVQLSNDTGRLCKKGYPNEGEPAEIICCCETGNCHSDNPHIINYDPRKYTYDCNGKRCGYQICQSTAGEGPCFTPETISRNCFDQKTKILYIRSNVEEKRGRKWITNINADGLP